MASAYTNGGGAGVRYYGKVRQSTGEAWVGCRLHLSTVAVHAGGSAPVLPTRRVGIHGPAAARGREGSERLVPRRGGGGSDSGGSDEDERALSTSEHEPRSRGPAHKKGGGGGGGGGKAASSAPPLRAAGVATAGVSASGGSAMFTIERPAMIDRWAT